jgi:hypothetical protein
MNSNFTTGMNKPSKFTAEQYGTKVSVEIDHSDMDLDEVMDVFETLIIGMGYHADSLKNWIIDKADEHRETDTENLKEKLEEWKFEDDDNDFFGQMDIDEKRMDIIGQNGNEGLHYEDDEDDIIVGASDEEGIDWDCTKYDGEGNLWETDEDEERYLATDEDEDEFSKDGGFDGKAHFEWGDEPEDDNLFEGDEWKPNQKLAEANERYKSEVKKMKSKKRNNKN